MDIQRRYFRVCQGYPILVDRAQGPDNAGLCYYSTNDPDITLAWLQREYRAYYTELVGTLAPVTWLPPSARAFVMSLSKNKEKNWHIRNNGFASWAPNMNVFWPLKDDIDCTCMSGMETRNSRMPIIGMDPSSIATVMALGIEKSSVGGNLLPVLDLCCCPGMKTMLMAELLENQDKPRIKVVGVDISLRRLFVARSLLARASSSASFSAPPHEEAGPSFKALGVVLIHGSATDITSDKINQSLAYYRRTSVSKRRRNLQKILENDGNPDSIITPTAVWLSPEIEGITADDRRAGNQKRQRGNTRPEEDERSSENDINRVVLPQRYHRVLLDAECTHDGSLSHIIDAEDTRGLAKYKPNYRLNPECCNYCLKNPSLGNEECKADQQCSCGGGLPALQLKMLLHSYRHLLARPHASGTGELNPNSCPALVYSTCSFSQRQNELVIAKFLALEGYDAVRQRRRLWRKHHGFNTDGNRAQYLCPVCCNSVKENSNGESDYMTLCGCFYARPVDPFAISSSYTIGRATAALAEIQSLAIISAEQNEHNWNGIKPPVIRLDPEATKSSFQFIAKIIPWPISDD